MLLGEDFGGGHEGGLEAIFDRLQAGQRRHHSLATADIALQQTAHRMRLCEVGADFLPGTLLSCCEREGQRVDEGLGQLLALRQGMGRASRTLSAGGGER